MSNKPITIQVGVEGTEKIMSARQELALLKNEMIAAGEGTAEFNKLAMRAGELRDQINSANEAMNVFAGGSSFEKISNGLGLIGTQLMSMDFEGASQSAKLLTSTITSMNPAQVAAGFKAFASTVGQLGNAFFQMGLKLLANPIFLLVAVVAAVVIAIVMLKDKIKIVSQAFDLMMMPIKLLIQGLKDLTDWLGLTTFAQDEAADAAIKAADKMSEANKKLTDDMAAEYDRQIKLAKANGKDTTALEVQKYQETSNIAKREVNSKNKALEAANTKYRNAVSEEDKKAAKETVDRLRKERDEQLKIYKDSTTDVEATLATARVKAEQEAQKAAEKAAADAKKSAEERQKAAEKFAQDRINAERRLQDLVLSVMTEGIDKELAKNQLAYDRAIEDVKRSKDLTIEEKKKMYDAIANVKLDADSKAQTAESKRLMDEEKLRVEAFKKEREAYQAQLDQIAAIKKAHNDFIFDETAKDKDKEIKALEDKYKAVSEANAKQMQDELALVGDDQLRRLEIISEYAGKEEELTKLKAQKIADIEKEAAEQAAKDKLDNLAKDFAVVSGFINQFGSALNGLLTQLSANRINDIKNEQEQKSQILSGQMEKELNAAGDDAKAKEAIQKKFDLLKYKNDVEANKRLNELKKKQFIRDKAFRLATAVADTASAVMQSFANNGGYPTGIPFAIAAGVAGALQIATIAATKFEGEAGPTSPAGGASIGGAGGSSQPSQPSYQLYGRSGQANEAAAPQAVNDNRTINVVAHVSETELTATQSRVARMQARAEL